MKNRIRLLLTIAATLVIAAPGAQGQEQTYKPIRAPMMPGIRAAKEMVLRQLTAPSLEEASGDALFASDLSSESQSGASNYATALGNGRLSAEISPWADLAVLRWPNPSYSDQLRYFTFNNNTLARHAKPVRVNKDAPSADWRRYGHPVEPCPGLGSRGGVQLPTGDVVWLGDPEWTSARGFDPPDSTVLVTTLTRPGLSVTVTDFIDPDRDFMVRSFQTSGEARQFFYHSTFAPFAAHPGEYTKSDPEGAGFAAVYSETEQAVIHFQPQAAASRGKRLMPAVATSADLDANYPEGGVFIAWGFIEPADAVQVGADRCRRHVAGPAPEAGRADAKDGSLSGNRSFLGPIDAALSRKLQSGSETVTVVIAAASTAGQAVAMIQDARRDGLEKLRGRAADHWKAVSASLHFPAAADPVTTRVIRRSVLNLIQAQDRESGEIVASISRQPHYHFDWPRDGAFFDMTLDLAGVPAAVTRHHAFYARTQYTKTLAYGPVFVFNYRTGFYNPSGHWRSNLAPDGTRGSMPSVMPFEIDETGLPAWDFWRHERSLAPADRPAYIAAMKATMERAADALLRFTDVKRGWVKPSLEDDNFPPECTLHGVSSVLAGLAAACDAGPRWGLPADKTAKYCEAAKSLRAGIRARSEFPQTLDEAGFRGLAWTLWPAPVFTDFREPGAKAIKERLAASIREKCDKQRGGFAYLGEEVYSLALADQYDHEYTELLTRALTLLTHEVAFPGTDCYGEVTLWGDFAGTGAKVAQQRTSIPHLWNGVTVYLSAIALYEPQLMNAMRPPAP
jgi:hypothetical protein